MLLDMEKSKTKIKAEIPEAIIVHDSDDVATTLHLSDIDRLNQRLFRHSNLTEHVWIENEKRIFESTLRNIGLVEKTLLAIYERCMPIITSTQEDEERGIKIEFQHVLSDKTETFFNTVRIATFVSRCALALRSRQADEVRLHLLWYAHQLHIIGQKKARVALWREYRTQQMRASKVENSQETGDSGRADKVVVEKDAEVSATEKKRMNKIAYQARTKKKETIARWHAEKERKEGKVLKEAELVAAKAVAEAASERQRKAETRQSLHLYHLRQQQEKEMKEEKIRLEKASARQLSSYDKVCKKVLKILVGFDFVDL